MVERQLAGHPSTGRFCHGDTPTLADCVLVPQIHNAQRFDCRLDHVPTVMRMFDDCMQLDAFGKTQPSACPDAALTAPAAGWPGLAAARLAGPGSAR